MSDLHFLRPLWFLLLLIIPLLPRLLQWLHQGQSGWARVMPRTLLTPLLSQTGMEGGQRRSPLLALSLLTVLLAFALAGPAWRQAPTPLQQQNDSLVVVLDLSLSMLATDVEPDRLTLAKRKIRDLLMERKGGFTALLVYAADAHVVTPLTDDRQTIEGLLDVVDPVIMPKPGNRPDLAISGPGNCWNRAPPGRVVSC